VEETSVVRSDRECEGQHDGEDYSDVAAVLQNDFVEV